MALRTLSLFRRVCGEDSKLRSSALLRVFICSSSGSVRSQTVVLNIFRVVGIATSFGSSSVLAARDTKIKEGTKKAFMVQKSL